ncbi:MAG: lysophospholipase, partial [Nitrolancea sp.]
GIVHGLGEHSGEYEHVVERLVPAGFAVYGFDLRGHGRSPGQRAFIRSWDDYRQDVRAFLNLVAEEQPGQPHFLLGHSLGGIIVLDFALRHPDGLRGVIALGPAIGELGISPALRALARVVSRVRPSFSLGTGLEASAISRDPEVVAAYRSDPLVHDRGTARLGVESERIVDFIHSHAAELRLPLLIQHGEADRIAGIDGSRRFIANVTEPDKTLIEYPGAYHQVHNDLCHETVTADLLAWLERYLD